MSVEAVTAATQLSNAQSQEVTDPAQEAAKETKVDNLSPKFAELAKKERMIRQQARAVQEEKAALEQRLKQREEEINKTWKERLQSNTFDVLHENGLTYDKLTEKLLAKGDPVAQTIMELRQEIEDLKNGFKENKESLTAAEKQQYENAKKQIKNDISALIDSSDQYETIKAFDYADQVVELIEKSFEETGTVMSNEEACNLVEEYLVEQYVADHNKFSKLKKLQAKLSPPQAEASEETADTKQQPTNQKQQPNTLSNRMVQTTKPLTQKERRERAILAFQGKL